MILVRNISGRTISRNECVLSGELEFIKDCNDCPHINLHCSYRRLPNVCITCITKEKGGTDELEEPIAFEDKY